MSSPSSLYPKKIDLTNCDKEPIHLLGKIQAHSLLFVLNDTDLSIQRVSENVFEFFSRKREDFSTFQLDDFLDEKSLQIIKNLVKGQKAQSFEVFLKSERFIAIPHFLDGLLYIELERLDGKNDAMVVQQQLSEIISVLSEAPSASQMCDDSARLIKDFLGYDRVMLYQFDEKWNGKIIAEAKEDHLESWMGMHYPATDIPQQARALFLKQGVRIISEVEANAIPIFQLYDAHNKPLDLSRCEARAVSPIHIEYLKNMKVSATMTAAIVFNGNLWGLIACHNYSPKFINYYQRLSIKFLTQVFSTQLTLKSSNEVLELINETSVHRAKLVEQMSNGWNVHKGLTDYEISLVDITEATGAAVFLDNNLSVVGNTPSSDEILDLIAWINRNREDNIYFTNVLIKEYVEGASFTDVASGVLCQFITPTKSDCLIWFKPELRQTISWGGNPEKAVLEDNQKISPRKSFERWNEEQRNTSLPWKDYEIASVRALNKSISDIIISNYAQVKELNEKLLEAYKELESFSYSVSHDLRAPLRGIDGFAQIIKEDYYESLDDYGKAAIETIINSTDKMNNLIDDILAFSGLGKKGTSTGEFSIQLVIEQTLQFLQVESQYPNVKLIVQEDFPMVYGDSGMVFQLLNNLIGNALKYSKTIKQPVIEIGHFTKNDLVTFFVKDNGVGFKSEYSEKIFGVFNRLVKDEYEGSGIGLAIAKRVIEKHGGKIWAQGIPDKGATFFFQLPVV